MRRMDALEYSFIPLGKDGDDKAPTVSFKGRPFSLKFCLNDMTKHDASTYGIRMDGLVVVDIDTHDQSIMDRCERRFGVPGMKVQTVNGQHWYYRAGDVVRSRNLRKKEGLPVDIKAGKNSYVMGPGSQRQTDAGEFMLIPLDGVTHPQGLPLFRDNQPAREHTVEGKVVEGVRDDHLFTEACAAGRRDCTEDEIFQHLVEIRAQLESPEDFSDEVLRAKVQTVMAYRRDGKLWSSQRIQPDTEIMSLLLEQHGYANGFTLYCCILKRGGYQRDWRDTLVIKHLVQQQWVKDWKRRPYERAIKELLDAGVLVIVQEQSKHVDQSSGEFTSEARVFKLSKPSVTGSAKCATIYNKHPPEGDGSPDQPGTAPQQLKPRRKR